MNRVSPLRQGSVCLADTNHMTVSEGRIRIRISLVIFLAMICVVLFRLADIALFSPDSPLREKPAPILDMRADMTDRNGVILATTLPSFWLYADPSQIWNTKETAEALVSILSDLNVDRVEALLDADNKASVSVYRGLSPKERQAIFDLGHPGLSFLTEPKRVYPNAPLAAHLVGWTNSDFKGVAGAELAFKDHLGTDNAPELALSIDARVQYAVAEELKASIDHFSALSGAAIVMDVRTGELMALVSLPNFNSNAYGAASSEQHLNHASMSTYDLGSVFKPLTIAMVLEDKLATRDEMFDVHKPYKVLNKFIRDDHPSPDPLNLDSVLAKSSNRGTAMLAQRIGAERQQYWLRQLGLLDRVPFELDESAHPQIQKRWHEMATVTVSYGHGLSVSPLALVTAIAATLNDGVYVTPTVLKRHATHRPETRRVFSSAVSRDVADMMRITVTHGTGRNADVPGFGVMGKTGTAEKPTVGGYDTDRLVTSFVAAFPHSAPRYAMIVTLDEPKAVEGTSGYATAGWNAAPTAGAIIERVGPMLPGARDVPQTGARQVEAFR